MTRPTEFQTEDIDLAAAIMTATDNYPQILRQPGRALVAFEFSGHETIPAIVIAYAIGELVQPVKRFAACRAWLYRRAKEAGRAMA